MPPDHCDLMQLQLFMQRLRRLARDRDTVTWKG